MQLLSIHAYRNNTSTKMTWKDRLAWPCVVSGNSGGNLNSTLAPPPCSHPHLLLEPSAGCLAKGKDGGGCACSLPLSHSLSASVVEVLYGCDDRRRVSTPSMYRSVEWLCMITAATS
jgi:hypothetical protein